jgi:tetratricopeptide repeat protein/photosynthetic reaction center cytochrome c subunit
MALRFVIRRIVIPAAIVTASPAVFTTLLAQGGGAPPQQRPPENLKFFPKDTPRDTLLNIMRGFTYALGVNCAFCHVEEPASQPGGRPQLRPALDDKVEKQTARFMLAMVDTLNRLTLANVPKRHETVRITCVTCHRGSPLPGTIETVLMDAVDQFGPDSAIARYRKLRETANNGRYDFTEFPVSNVSRTLADRGKTDPAIALLAMSQEFNPSSADIDLQMAGIYEKAGDKDKAITRYQAALTKRPNDPRARGGLTRLGKPPA